MLLSKVNAIRNIFYNSLAPNSYNAGAIESNFMHILKKVRLQ